MEEPQPEGDSVPVVLEYNETEGNPEALGAVLGDEDGVNVKLLVKDASNEAVTDGLKLLELQAEAVGL